MLRDWVPLGVALCALVAALSNTRGSIRAARGNEDANQIKWFQEAKKEAEAAKHDAEETREASAETRRELAQTRREVAELRDLLEELTRWTLRVLVWKDDPAIGLDELRALIDGGPPSFRSRQGVRDDGPETFPRRPGA